MKITPVSTLEDMFSYIHDNLKSADTRVNERQKLAAIGDCFIRLELDEDLVIYGEILDPSKPANEDHEYNEVILKEIEEEAVIYQEPHMKYMRWSRCFSVACDDGELGDTHCCTMNKFIKRATFEEARKRKWPNTPTDLLRLLMDCGESIEPIEVSG